MSRKPKIMLHIIMPNQVSGPNNAARLIANSYLNEKYEFGFLTQEFHAGGKLNWKLVRALMKQIKQFSPDVLHLTGLQASGFHAVLAAHLCGYNNILLTIRGASVSAINLSKSSRFIFGKIVEPLTMRWSRKVFTVAQAMADRDYIKKHTKGKLLETIHNSAPIVNKDALPVLDLKEKLGVDKDSILVVTVGRIVYDKGVTYIADAIKQINNDKIKFLFIGNEPQNSVHLDKILEQEIKDKRVFLLGKQENVLSIINECDIFLFATLHENLSNALLEACSVGLGVIATNVGGNPEVIEDGKNGILIPPSDSESIKESVIKLSENKVLREEYGRQAIKTVESKFSQEYILSKLEKVYEEMLK